MGTIHELITTHGFQRARELVSPKEHEHIDIAREVMSDEASRTGFTYSGFCLTCLPHRRLKSNEQVWVRKGHKLTMHVAPGHLELDDENKPIMLGVPYGTRSRLVLLYLTSRALQTGCREVELSGSMRAWMEDHRISTGGSSYRDIQEACKRLSACKMLFLWDKEVNGRKIGDALAKADLIQGGLFLSDCDPRQGSLWRDTVTLSETFFNALREHPVPVRMSAIRAISSKSAVIDLYLWLAYRLHSLKEPTPITFASLRDQFGAGYELSSHYAFRRKFIENLSSAASAYPEAKLEVEASHIVLHPSPPPIPETSEDRRLMRLQGF